MGNEHSGSGGGGDSGSGSGNGSGSARGGGSGGGGAHAFLCVSRTLVSLPMQVSSGCYKSGISAQKEQ